MTFGKIVIAALSAILICIFAAVLLKGRKTGKGRAAELAVAARLKKIARKDRMVVMNNVYLPLYDGSCEIDHILFGSFGVLAVETKGVSGVISGSGKYLEHSIGSKVHKMYNPQLQNRTHTDNIRHHLRKSNINAPVYGVVVFTARDVVFDRSVGISIDDLESFVSSLPHSSCSVTETVSAIQAVRIHNPFKKMFHDHEVALKNNTQ